MGYQVTLLPSNASGANSTMWRYGHQFHVGETETLDLDDMQAEVFRNDWRFDVKDTKDRGATLTGATSTGSETSTSDSVAGTETNSSATSAKVEDSSVASEKEASGAVETPSKRKR